MSAGIYGAPGLVNTRNASGTEVGVLAAPLRIDPTGTTAQPVTTTGDTWLPYGNAALTNTAGGVQVKGAAGAVGAITIYNPSNAVAFVQFFDLASAVTLGTTTPTFVVGVPTLVSFYFTIPQGGLSFANAIKIAATTTATGSTAPSTALVFTMAYR